MRESGKRDGERVYEFIVGRAQPGHDEGFFKLHERPFDQNVGTISTGDPESLGCMVFVVDVTLSKGD